MPTIPTPSQEGLEAITELSGGSWNEEIKPLQESLAQPGVGQARQVIEKVAALRKKLPALAADLGAEKAEAVAAVSPLATRADEARKRSFWKLEEPASRSPTREPLLSTSCVLPSLSPTLSTLEVHRFLSMTAGPTLLTTRALGPIPSIPTAHSLPASINELGA